MTGDLINFLPQASCMFLQLLEQLPLFPYHFVWSQDRSYGKHILQLELVTTKKVLHLGLRLRKCHFSRRSNFVILCGQ